MFSSVQFCSVLFSSVFSSVSVQFSFYVFSSVQFYSILFSSCSFLVCSVFCVQFCSFCVQFFVHSVFSYVQICSVLCYSILFSFVLIYIQFCSFLVSSMFSSVCNSVQFFAHFYSVPVQFYSFCSVLCSLSVLFSSVFTSDPVLLCLVLFRSVFSFCSVLVQFCSVLFSALCSVLCVVLFNSVQFC